jgi:hypothetical protein
MTDAELIAEYLKHLRWCNRAQSYMHYSTPEFAKTALRRTHLSETKGESE